MSVASRAVALDPDADGDVGLARLEGGGLLSVPGLTGCGVATGVKSGGALDLALVVADAPRTAAGVFTRSEAAAPPVLLFREQLRRQPALRALAINSGNANALTGTRGERDARRMVERVEARCGAPAAVLSTGVIGVPLPIDRVLDGIDRAATATRRDAGDDVARAILTTDTTTKTCAVRVALPAAAGQPTTEVTVGGVAKGSGMIHPNMATMLAVIATDAEVRPAALAALLRRAVDRSFHEITVDGDTSTNDAVIALAGGSGRAPIEDDARLAPLGAAFDHVARDLAQKIVCDGEGASRVMRVEVSGARSDEQAQAVARGVAGSSLVKTALAGGDPNWGRIIAAAGATRSNIDLDRLRLTLGEVAVFADGGAIDYDKHAADRAFSGPLVHVALDLGQGTSTARMLTSDLTKGYVEINAEYTT